MHYVPATLLSIDTNPKTVKGQRYGFLTGVLYLAPHTLSGTNLCPLAHVARCVEACLNTAGNPAYTQSKATGRLNKARYYLSDREGFMVHLVRDVARLVRRADTLGLIPLVRLNGTSDIRWEIIPVTIDAQTARRVGVPEGTHENIMAVFPAVQFYDYTKIPNRGRGALSDGTKIPNRHSIPANYDLTFSYSGVPAFAPYVARARAAGMRIAVVFRSKRSIPASFLNLTCVDGDDSDVRHLDPQGVVVALYAKGRAKTNTSGFVVDTMLTLTPTRRFIPLAIAA